MLEKNYQKDLEWKQKFSNDIAKFRKKYTKTKQY